MAREVIPEREVLEFMKQIPTNKERTFYIEETNEKFAVKKCNK